MAILFTEFLKDLPLRVFADKHSNGTSPERGLHIYLSASFHLEFKANPSGDEHSQLLQAALACNAAMNHHSSIDSETQAQQKNMNCYANYHCSFNYNVPLRAVVKEYVEGSISSATKVAI